MPKPKRAKTIKTIYEAIVEYISNNSTFESFDAINSTIKKIESANSIDEIFRIPIEERLYNFTNSLEWLYFICFIINVIKDEYIEVPNTFNMIFSTDSAIIYLSNTYSSATKTFYIDYFDDSDSDSEE